MEHWIANLPDNLKLHNDSRRSEYCRDIAELHIHYFTCVILFIHLYGHVVDPSMMADTSLVASSCMARLYDEIDDHDEINYLTPVHNWSLMVACIPQIHRLGDIEVLPGEHDLCNTELEIFVTALRCMRLKWPPANNILSTLDRLHTYKSHAIPHETPSKPIRPRVVLQGLFPFPENMCPRMAMVDPQPQSVKQNIGIQGVTTPLPDGSMDWIFDEFNLDYLELPFLG